MVLTVKVSGEEEFYNGNDMEAQAYVLIPLNASYTVYVLFMHEAIRINELKMSRNALSGWFQSHCAMECDLMK